MATQTQTPPQSSRPIPFVKGLPLLATLAQRVSFELASQERVEPDPYHALTLRPKGGLPVIVKRRESH